MFFLIIWCVKWLLDRTWILVHGFVESLFFGSVSRFLWTLLEIIPTWHVSFPSSHPKVSDASSLLPRNFLWSASSLSLEWFNHVLSAQGLDFLRSLDGSNFYSAININGSFAFTPKVAPVLPVGWTGRIDFRVAHPPSASQVCFTEKSNDGGLTWTSLQGSADNLADGGADGLWHSYLWVNRGIAKWS